MALYLLHARSPQPVLRVLLQQTHQNVLKLRRCLHKEPMYVRNLKRLVEDGLEQLHSVLTAEWRETCDHLVYYAPQAPPVDCLVMALLFYYLWSQILRGSTDRHRLLILEVQRPRQPKVSKLDIARFIKKYIFGFQAKIKQRHTPYR